MELGGEKAYLALLISLIIGYTGLHISVMKYREYKHDRFMEMKAKVSKIESELTIINSDVIEAKNQYLILLERRHNRNMYNPNDSLETENLLRQAKLELDLKLKEQILIQNKIDSCRQTFKK
jgi:hypothetical protein